MYELIFTLVLIVIGYVFGSIAERKHYKSILQREDRLREVRVISAKVPQVSNGQHCGLVMGSVVVSVDYFKTIVAGLRTLVGGRVSSYESLLDRGRREAILRMQQQAFELGAHYVFNVKMETCRIGENGGKSLGSVEVLAYGTAIKHSEPAA